MEARTLRSGLFCFDCVGFGPFLTCYVVRVFMTQEMADMKTVAESMIGELEIMVTFSVRLYMLSP